MVTRLPFSSFKSILPAGYGPPFPYSNVSSIEIPWYCTCYCKNIIMSSIKDGMSYFEGAKVKDSKGYLSFVNSHLYLSFCRNIRMCMLAGMNYSAIDTLV